MEIQTVTNVIHTQTMISAITNQRKVRLMFYREMMDASLLKRFMSRLIQSSDRKIFLILDNLRVHHSSVLAPWPESHKAKIELFYLPSYSPDLNTDERMNSDLKSALSKKPDSKVKGRMEHNAAVPPRRTARDSRDIYPLGNRAFSKMYSPTLKNPGQYPYFEVSWDICESQSIFAVYFTSIHRDGLNVS